MQGSGTLFLLSKTKWNILFLYKKEARKERNLPGATAATLGVTLVGTSYGAEHGLSHNVTVSWWAEGFQMRSIRKIIITWNVLGMQILNFHPGPTELGILGVGPSNLSFNALPGDSDAQ